MFDKIGFSEYVSKQSWCTKDEVPERIKDIEDFHAFLAQRGIDGTRDISRDDVATYVVTIRDKCENMYSTLLSIAIYGDFSRNEDLCSEAFLSFDAVNVMSRMSELTKENFGQEVWQKIFGDIDMPEIGWTLDEMSHFTREMDKRFHAVVPCDQYEHICAKNAHAWNPEWNGRDREKFLEMNSVDRFIEAYNDDFMKELEAFYDSGELFFSQIIDGDVIAYMKENPICRREGNRLYFKKIPFNVRRYLRETDVMVKRYHACHCPWVKKSILQEEGPVSRSFCHCSLGHDKKNFDVAFDRELTGRVVESVMDVDGLSCIFEVDIPDDIMEQYA